MTTTKIEHVLTILECPSIVLNGYDLRTVARLAIALDNPTIDAFAEFVWRLSNNEALSVQAATQFMHAAGYEAFKGFPLRKRGDA